MKELKKKGEKVEEEPEECCVTEGDPIRKVGFSDL
jgi:hypothetical protein